MWTHQTVIGRTNLLGAVRQCFLRENSTTGAWKNAAASVNDVWLKRTEDMFRRDHGRVNDKEALETVAWWTRQNCQQSVDTSLKLLNRLHQRNPSILSPKVVHAVVNHWKRIHPQNPQQVLSQIDSYKDDVRILEATYAMILDSPHSTPDMAMKFLSAHPDHPKALACAIQVCMRNRQQQEAETWLKRLLQVVAQQDENSSSEVVDQNYTIALHSCAQVKSQQATDWALELWKHISHPNTIHYNALLNCLSHRPQQALAFLYDMPEPDEISYSTVLKQLAEHGLAEAAETLLQELPGRLTTPIEHTCVIRAWSKYQERNPEYAQVAAQRAEDVFARMCQTIAPDVIAFTTVLDCWARCGDGVRASRFFTNMLDIVTPDEKAYASVIRAWSSSPQRDAPWKAEEWLLRMEEARLQAGAIVYTPIFKAWARSKHPNAPYRAQELLRRMWEKYEKGQTFAKPNVYSYSTVMSCWSHSGHLDAPAQAEHLLEEMKALGIEPNEVSYGTVIHAWSRSRQQEAPYRAEELFREMIHRQLKPDKTTFTSLLSAWTRSCEPEAPHRAEEILKRMQQLRQIDPGFKPNVIHFTSVLNCWAHSNEPGAAQRATSILQRMRERNLRPNTISYNTVLQAWSRSGQPSSPQEAERLLEEMKAQGGPAEFKPNAATYMAVMITWCKSNNPMATVRVQALLEDMTENLQNPPNTKTFAALFDCLGSSHVPWKVELTQALLRTMAQYGLSPNDQAKGALTKEP